MAALLIIIPPLLLLDREGPCCVGVVEYVGGGRIQHNIMDCPLPVLTIRV
jgi:hypothetical protein